MNDAIISPCGLYRYTLHRKIDQPTRLVKPALFIMLNPSTADAIEDDNTIRKCIKFARREGCTSMTVVNLFALRSKDPEVLYSANDPVGPDNDEHLLTELKRCRYGLTVAAWGNHGILHGRDLVVRSLAKGNGIALQCIKVTAKKQPIHPLYQPDNSPFVNLEDARP